MAVMVTKTATRTASISTTQSTTLVKNLFRAAFSSVAYIRNFFEDNCFQLGRIGTTRYHKISSVERADIKSFVDWLEQGVFDALQKKYLEVVLLEISEQSNSKKSKKMSSGEKRKLVECYRFNILYTDGNPRLSLAADDDVDSTSISKEQIKQTTSEVLRSLVQLTSLLSPLPANRILSMKLLYTKDTPMEYEPPLFQKAPEEEACWFQETPTCVGAGAVTTPFHQISMVIQTGKKTAGKISSAADKDGKPREGKTRKFVKSEHIGLERGEDNDQGSDPVNVVKFNADFGQGQKASSLTQSEDMDIDGGDGHSFDLQERKASTTKKNGTGRKHEKAGKKRKASRSVKDIANKRQRGKRSV